MSFSLKHAIRVAVLTEPSKKWPTYDGHELKRYDYLSASEASKCVRELAFNKHEEQKKVQIDDFWNQITDDEFESHLRGMGDSDVRGIFSRGNWMEEWVVDQLLATADGGVEYYFVGKDQRSFYTNEHRLSGTPDGVRVDWDAMTYRVLEFKSTQNPIYDARPAHRTQLGFNMSLLGGIFSEGLADEPCDAPFSSLTQEDGLLLYVNTDNYLLMNEYAVPVDPAHEVYHRSAAKARALFSVDCNGAVTVADPATLVAEGLQNRGCYFCKHKSACAAIEKAAGNLGDAQKLTEAVTYAGGDVPEMPKFADNAQRDEILSSLFTYASYDADEKQAKKKKDAMKPALRAWLDTQSNNKAEFEAEGQLVKASNTKSERKGSIDEGHLDKFLSDNADKLGKLLTNNAFRKDSTETETLTVSVKPQRG